MNSSDVTLTMRATVEIMRRNCKRPNCRFVAVNEFSIDWQKESALQLTT